MNAKIHLDGGMRQNALGNAVKGFSPVLTQSPMLSLFSSSLYSLLCFPTGDLSACI